MFPCCHKSFITKFVIELYVACTPGAVPSVCTVLWYVGSVWKIGQDCQSMAWRNGMKILINQLSWLIWISGLESTNSPQRGGWRPWAMSPDARVSGRFAFKMCLFLRDPFALRSFGVCSTTTQCPETATINKYGTVNSGDTHTFHCSSRCACCHLILLLFVLQTLSALSS